MFMSSVFAQAEQIEPFEDLEEMKSWLENYQNQNGTNLEERLRNAVQKSKKDKCTKIVTSLSTILEKLKLAENNPLSLDRRSIQAISDLNGKLANLRNFFKQPFLDALLQRHSNLVEIFDIKIQAETKLNQNKSNSSNLVERKMSFYTQIKDSIEAKKLGNEGLDKILKSKIEALTSANNIVLWAEEALSGIKAILRVDVKHLIDDKDGVLQEAANWKTQAQTRLLQLEEIESSGLRDANAKKLTEIEVFCRHSRHFSNFRLTEKFVKVVDDAGKNVNKCQKNDALDKISINADCRTGDSREKIEVLSLLN